MQRNVLLVDDNMSVTQIIKALLQRFDFRVQTTTNPDQVLHMLSQDDYDLVISDVMMPGMDGFTLGRKIKEKTSEMPIIYLTALDTVEDQFEAWLSGGDAYMTKPFKAQELVQKIEEVLNRGPRKTGALKAGRFAAPHDRPRVLAAVLEHTRRRLLTAAMRIADCDIEFTEDVEGALKKLDHERFHALICDARLEDDLPRRLREFMRFFALAIPVIFLHGDEGPPSLQGPKGQFSTFSLPDTPAVFGAYVRNAIDDCGWAG